MNVAKEPPFLSAAYNNTAVGMERLSEAHKQEKAL